MLPLSPFALAALFTSLSCLWVAGIFLLYGKNFLHRLWAVLNLILTGWSLLVALAVSTKDPHHAYLLWNAAHIIGIYVAITFFHCVPYFCNLNARTLIKISYAYGIAFDCISLLNPGLLYDGTAYLFNSMHYIQYKKVSFIISMSLWVFLAFYANYKLFQFYKNSPEEQQQKQSRFFLIGGIIGFLGGSSTFLPV